MYIYNKFTLITSVQLLELNTSDDQIPVMKYEIHRGKRRKIIHACQMEEVIKQNKVLLTGKKQSGRRLVNAVTSFQVPTLASGTRQTKAISASVI